MPWTDEEITTFMRQAYEQYGRIPTIAEYRDFQISNGSRCPCVDTICQISGKRHSWKEAFRIRIGVEDNGLTFEQAAKILKMINEAIGDDFLSYEIFKKYKKAHPEQNIPGDTIIKNALGAKTWNEAKQNAGLEALPHNSGRQKRQV